MNGERCLEGLSGFIYPSAEYMRGISILHKEHASTCSYFALYLYEVYHLELVGDLKWDLT